MAKLKTEPEMPSLVYPVYEEQLHADHWWAVHEGWKHFRGESTVQDALRRIANKLDDLHIPYAVVGGLALNFHGYVRFTEDVDLVVTKESLKAIHANLTGLGYRPAFQGSKHLRETESGVRIEFLLTGEYPGDGKPKPVSFPDPIGSSVNIDGIQCVQLEGLIELKLASGTTPGRRKDLGDVQELIKFAGLPAELSDKLDPSVRDLYVELWNELRQAEEFKTAPQ
jgi:hypothetical protein